MGKLSRAWNVTETLLLEYVRAPDTVEEVAAFPLYPESQSLAGDYVDQEWKDGPVGRQMTKHTNGRNAYFAALRQRAARCHPKSPCNRCVRNFMGT